MQFTAKSSNVAGYLHAITTRHVSVSLGRVLVIKELDSVCGEVKGSV
jgi:hypothetical protein